MSEQPVYTVPPQNNNKTIIYIVVGVLVFCCCCFGGIGIFLIATEVLSQMPAF